MRNPANKQTNKQTNRHTKVIAISRFSRDNNAAFDSLPITEAHCSIGCTRYPGPEFHINFTGNKRNGAHNEFIQFYENYRSGEVAPMISYKNVKDVYPICVFDYQARKMLSADKFLKFISHLLRCLMLQDR